MRDDAGKPARCVARSLPLGGGVAGFFSLCRSPAKSPLAPFPRRPRASFSPFVLSARAPRRSADGSARRRIALLLGPHARLRRHRVKLLPRTKIEARGGWPRHPRKPRGRAAPSSGAAVAKTTDGSRRQLSRTSLLPPRCGPVRRSSTGGEEGGRTSRGRLLAPAPSARARVRPRRAPPPPPPPAPRARSPPCSPSRGPFLPPLRASAALAPPPPPRAAAAAVTPPASAVTCPAPALPRSGAALPPFESFRASAALSGARSAPARTALATAPRAPSATPGTHRSAPNPSSRPQNLREKHRIV